MKAKLLFTLLLAVFFIISNNTFSQMDPTFGNDGVVITDLGSSIEFAFASVLQPDGKIIVTGSTKDPSNNNQLAIVRYDSNGNLDNSFGTNGIVITNNGTSTIGKSVAIQPDGKIVVAGYSTTLSMTSISVVRYNTDGSLDTSFDGDGKVIQAIYDSTFLRHAVEELAIQSDGKILVAGYIEYTNETKDFF